MLAVLISGRRTARPSRVWKNRVPLEEGQERGPRAARTGPPAGMLAPPRATPPAPPLARVQSRSDVAGGPRGRWGGAAWTRGEPPDGSGVDWPRECPAVPGDGRGSGKAWADSPASAGRPGRTRAPHSPARPGPAQSGAGLTSSRPLSVCVVLPSPPVLCFPASPF